jgi:hypothetical protein
MTAPDLRGTRIAAFVPRLWPTQGSGNQRTSAFVRGFIEHGAHVTAFVPDSDVHVDRPTWLDAVDLHLIPDPLTGVPWPALLAAQWFGLPDASVVVQRGARRRAQRADADAIFVSAAPFSAFSAAASLACNRGLPLVADLRDEWSRNPFAGRLGPFHRALEGRREDAALAVTTAISAPIPEILEALRRPFPGTSRVIDHGADVDLVEQLVGPPRPLQAHEPLVLVYAGARYGDVNEDRFLRALGQLTDDRPVVLRLIGAERAVRVPVPSHVEVVVRPLISHADLMREYDKAHAVLNFLPSEGGSHSVRSKFEEYKATGRPILSLAPDGSRLLRATASTPGGHAVMEGDVPGLGRALHAIIDQAQLGIDFRGERSTRTWADVGREAAELLQSALPQTRQ